MGEKQFKRHWDGIVESFWIWVYDKAWKAGVLLVLAIVYSAIAFIWRLPKHWQYTGVGVVAALIIILLFSKAIAHLQRRNYHRGGLTEIQKQMILTLGDDSASQMPYRDLLVILDRSDIPRGQLHMERRRLEWIRLVEYSKGEVWLTRRGLEVYDKFQARESQRIETDEIHTLGSSGDVLMPDMNAWDAVNYILDETDAGIGKEWHQIVSLLRWSACSEKTPLLVFGVRADGTQRDQIRSELMLENTLEIDIGGESWIGERVNTPGLLRGEQDKELYNYIQFSRKQIRSRWPRGRSRNTSNLSQRQYIRAWRSVIERHYQQNRHHTQLEGRHILAQLAVWYPVWSVLKDSLQNHPSNGASLEQVFSWLKENVDRLEREWGLLEESGRGREEETN